MDLQRIWAVLVGRRLIVVATCGACVVLALAYGAVAPKRYLATAYLVTGGSASAIPGAGTSSQAELATNPRVIRRALQQLDSTPLPEDTMERLEKSVARGMTVAPQRDSNVVLLSYAANDPRVASATANALANAYLEVSGDLRKEPLQRDVTAIQAQLRVLQAQANDARAELVAFKRKSGLVMSDERMDAEQTLLNELIRRAAESRGRADAATSASTGQGSLLQSMQLAVLQARAHLGDVAGRLGPNHPDYATALTGLSQAQAVLAAETKRVGASTRTATDGAGPLGNAVERQKTVVRGLSGDREQLVFLQRNADDASRLLQTMRERLYQTQLDSARGVDGGILLTAARPPQDPVSPGLSKIVPLAALLGLFGGAFFVLAWEQIAPRVRRPDDLLVHTGIEVLTSVPLTKRIERVRGPKQIAGPFLDDRRLSAASAASRPIGNLLVAFGAMSRLDAESVVNVQRESGTPFGRTAVAMGLISDVQLRKALSVQYGRPRVTSNKRGPSASLVVDQEPDHPVAGALRALRSQLLLRPPGQRPAVITITSVDEKDGRTFVASNLAIAFSQIGKRVLLIDANLRTPSLHHLFDFPNERGLSGYLARRHGAPKVHEVGARGSFGVMLAGPIPPNPEELLSSHQLGILLHSLRSVFEVIVIDTPATAVGADAHLLSARAGSTLMVSRLHVTGLDEIGRLSRKFAAQNVQIIGTIVNEA